MRTSTLLMNALLPALMGAGTLHAQTARVQVIHNCADLAAGVVDVWVNDMLLLDDFAFRTASPFVDAPAGVMLTLGIAPSNSMNSNESIFSQDVMLEDGGSYIVVATGIVSGSGYTPSPAFGLAIYEGARETAEGEGTDVLVYHGSTDAPTVDVFESAVVNTTIVDDLSYMDYAGYLELPTLDFTLQVRTADNTTIVAAYLAPLAALSLEGTAITVLASGFLDPSTNSDGPAFGLFAATAAGGPLVELPGAPLPGPARAQVIHNSADAAAAVVDVYLNSSILLDDFAFRTASPFVDLPSGVELTIGIAPSNSTSAGDAIAEFMYVLEEGATYVIVANGIVSAAGYTPATPFDLYVSEGQEVAMMAGNTDVLVFHGATDAPVVDVAELAVLEGAIVVDDIAYGDFQGYLELPTLDFVLQVQTQDGTPVAAYQAPLASLGLADAALVVLASGFLDPGVNSNGEPFGLYVALPSGGPLVALPLSTSVNENDELAGMTIWPNPATDHLFIDMGIAAPADIRLLDQLGRTVLVRDGRSVTSGEGRLVIDLSGIAHGSYLIEVGTPVSRRTMPVVVGH